DQRNLLTLFVRERLSQGRRVVVALDDADRFAPGAWDEIERLLAWRIDGRPALDVLVAGTLPFGRKLRDAGLLTRDTPLAKLEPPTRADVRAYLDWRLAPFTP